MVETTKQFPPPANNLNNSESNLRLTFHLGISSFKFIYFFIIVKLANLCRSFLILSAHIPKSLKENFIMIWESFGMLYHLKYMLNRSISVTLGTITFLCDTFMILLPITLLLVRVKETFLVLDEQLYS